MRATASATLSFGLVAVPVKLYTATESKEKIAFNMLHATCGSRLKQQYVCPRDGEIVERAGMVKGYEFAKDRYVTFTPEEIKSLEEAATQGLAAALVRPEEVGLFALGLYKQTKDGRRIVKVMSLTWRPKFKHLKAGDVVEVEGAEVFPSGAVRHGDIKRERKDKPAESCTYEAAVAS